LSPPAQALVPRWLVVAVIVMGLLLVVGAIVVGTEVSRRLSSPKPAAAPAGAAPATASDTPFRQKIELPAGSQVISMNPVGDRLVVQVENQDGLTSAYVIDPRTGTLLGIIDFPSGASR
jgi:hypothetical protein